MLFYDRIDVSEEIEVDKTGALKECHICHSCNFLDNGFKF